MVVMTPAGTREITSIPLGMLDDSNPASRTIMPKKQSGDAKQPPSALTKEKIMAALVACGNRRNETAEYLGISRRQLQYKIKEYHLPSRCHFDQKAAEK
ncbi:MAG: helix-turn-helix domain-containing protein [Oscillibacter sp.]|nr:helix-turn-helix domain-containing protein [Oscillibacter sp.]